jgi:hypothetical protein
MIYCSAYIYTYYNNVTLQTIQYILNVKIYNPGFSSRVLTYYLVTHTVCTVQRHIYANKNVNNIGNKTKSDIIMRQILLWLYSYQTRVAVIAWLILYLNARVTYTLSRVTFNIIVTIYYCTDVYEKSILKDLYWFFFFVFIYIPHLSLFIYIYATEF